jgi:hypothetical protein
MADLDTRQKRESGIGISLPFARVLPTPDGSDADGEDERAHLAMNYNGITTAVASGRIMGSLIGPSGLVGHGGGLIG